MSSTLSLHCGIEFNSIFAMETLVPSRRTAGCWLLLSNWSFWTSLAIASRRMALSQSSSTAWSYLGDLDCHLPHWRLFKLNEILYSLCWPKLSWVTRKTKLIERQIRMDFFSTVSHYRFIISGRVWCSFASSLWSTPLPLKFKCFLWLARKKRLNSREFITHRIGKNLGGCVLCQCSIESVDHLFFACPSSLLFGKPFVSCCAFCFHTIPLKPSA